MEIFDAFRNNELGGKHLDSESFLNVFKHLQRSSQLVRLVMQGIQLVQVLACHAFWELSAL